MILPDAWKIGVGATVVLTVAGVLAWLFVARANLKADLASTQAGYALCRAANDDWAAKALAFNEAARKLQEEAAARATLAAEAEAKAAKAANVHTKKANAILDRSYKGDDCLAAKALLDDYRKRQK